MAGAARRTGFSAAFTKGTAGSRPAGGEIAFAGGRAAPRDRDGLAGFETDWRDAHPGVNAVTLAVIAKDVVERPPSQTRWPRSASNGTPDDGTNLRLVREARERRGVRFDWAA